MGRYSYSNKTEADGLKHISTQFLKKHGYFNSGWRSGTLTFSRNGSETGSVSIQSSISEEEQYIRFIYTQTDNSTGKKTDCNYKIPLATTQCNFGGKRCWFICSWYVNGKYCGRRAGTLYLSNKYFACRHCNNLTYASRKLSGISKIAGQVISFPELEKLEGEVKRKYYAGKITRRYKRYLSKQEKAERQLMVMARHFDGESINDAIYRQRK